MPGHGWEKIGGGCPGCGSPHVCAGLECECWFCEDCDLTFECEDHRPPPSCCNGRGFGWIACTACHGAGCDACAAIGRVKIPCPECRP